MANNRLLLRDTTTGEELVVAKTHGSGWDWLRDPQQMNDWLAGSDQDASYGGAGPTTLVLDTETKRPPVPELAPVVGPDGRDERGDLVAELRGAEREATRAVVTLDRSAAAFATICEVIGMPATDPEAIVRQVRGMVRLINAKLDDESCL